jgi:hypothetical protein
MPPMSTIALLYRLGNYCSTDTLLIASCLSNHVFIKVDMISTRILNHLPSSLGFQHELSTGTYVPNGDFALNFV